MTRDEERVVRKKWPIAVLIVVVAIVAVAAVAWFVWMPSYRPALASGESYGIDVSHHQGTIDWETVARDDIEFVYIKATEGGDHIDRQFTENWEGAHQAGLKRGAYHFFTLCRNGMEQAENFLTAVPTDSGSLPPALDLEIGGNCSERPSQSEVDREVDAFIEQVEAQTGQTVVLYIGDDWESVYPSRDRLDRPLWYRQILRKPPRDDWWIWQFNYRSKVDGIEGDVDLNVMQCTAGS